MNKLERQICLENFFSRKFKVFNKNNFRILTLSIKTVSLLLSSCSDNIDNTNNSKPHSQNETEINNSKVPWLLVLVAVKIVSEVVDGRYYEDITYYSNGQIKSKKCGCRGLIGTCSINSKCAVSGQNLSLEPTEIELNESGIITPINAEIIKSDIGIVYGIDKIKDPADCSYFFNSGIKDISGPLVIDNPYVLNQLGLTEPIIIKGEYQVYESENYKYIIIHE